MKHIIKCLLWKMGLTVFLNKSMRRGISLSVDLFRLRPLLGPSPVLFDVGANVGGFSREICRIMPESLIYAFEPIPDAFQLLKANCHGKKNIHFYEIALSDESGTACMQIGKRLSISKIVAEPDGISEQTLKVPKMNIDTFVQENKVEEIDLLKIDTEGHDFSVIKGAEQTISRRAIRLIYAEVNFRGDGEHGDFYQIDHFLRENGYSLYAFYDWSPWTTDLSRRGFTNCLYIQNEVAARLRELRA